MSIDLTGLKKNLWGRIFNDVTCADCGVDPFIVDTVKQRDQIGQARRPAFPLAAFREYRLTTPIAEWERNTAELAPISMAKELS
jgi:hypothetical protein